MVLQVARSILNSTIIGAGTRDRGGLEFMGDMSWALADITAHCHVHKYRFRKEVSGSLEVFQSLSTAF